MYGFLTIYEQTIFLNQGFENGECVLYVSDVIHQSAGGGVPNVKQCFWYLGKWPAGGYIAINNTPLGEWVEM